MTNGAIAAGGAAGAAAAAAIANAIKASGAIVQVESRDFEALLHRAGDPLVVCSVDWVGCSINCRRAVWGMSPIPGSALAKINRSRQASSALRLALIC